MKPAQFVWISNLHSKINGQTFSKLFQLKFHIKHAQLNAFVVTKISILVTLFIKKTQPIILKYSTCEWFISSFNYTLWTRSSILPYGRTYTYTVHSNSFWSKDSRTASTFLHLCQHNLISFGFLNLKTNEKGLILSLN